MVERGGKRRQEEGRGGKRKQEEGRGGKRKQEEVRGSKRIFGLRLSLGFLLLPL